jgi:hypothetical protein
MSAWKEYKERLGVTRPWDLLNSSVERTSEEEARFRYNACLECDRLITSTKQCKECGCIMPLKTKIKNATCPIGKW